MVDLTFEGKSGELFSAFIALRKPLVPLSVHENVFLWKCIYYRIKFYISMSNFIQRTFPKENKCVLFYRTLSKTANLQKYCIPMLKHIVPINHLLQPQNTLNIKICLPQYSDESCSHVIHHTPTTNPPVLSTAAQKHESSYVTGT
jgi:hypothetical protein